MEKHKCKLCLKTFRDGRALGGHMRSHMLNLYSKEQLSENTESARSDECADADEDVNEELIYELRENPKRNSRFVDHEFSFPIDAGSVVVEDSASETESSKNPIRRRSKRIRKLVNVDHHQWQFQSAKKAMKSSKLSKTESDPMSSISDTTPEENVAFCLMMLSRDIWKRDELEDDDDDEYEVEHEKYTYVEADESYSYSDNDEQDVKTLKSTRTRTKYKCETCNKVFKSYQALGGHRASHKKIKLHQNQNNHNPNQNTDVLETDGNSTMVEEKIHECPVCYRVFSSGQALGGHKRSHVTGSSSNIPIVAPVRPVAKHGDNNLIDLNLPAPIDEDDCSQIELSAVSDAECVNLMKR